MFLRPCGNDPIKSPPWLERLATRRMNHQPIHRILALCSATVTATLWVDGAWAQQHEEDGRGHGLAADPIPLQTDHFPKRPRLLLEIGERFLDSGHLSQGIRLPTGAVWRPALWVFGTYRSSVQGFDNGVTENGEWAHRLDIFANLRLTGTERVLIGFRPADEFGGLGYNFGSGITDGWQDDFNGRIETLFFEGDFGELFPFLDDDDSRPFDIGFAVGRQNLSFQEGILINDNIDAVGFTRNSLRPPGTSNLRITGLFGWNDIHRNNVEDSSARLLALLTEVDFPFSTIAVDLVYTIAGDVTGDAVYGGVGAVQRIGRFNTAFRVNVSLPVSASTVAVTRGALLFSEISWTPHHTENLFYITSFWAVGTFSPAARALGGPLGRAGILFESPGIGRFGSPLNSRAGDVVGGAIGHQMFFAHDRRQLIAELAGRKDTNAAGEAAVALGLRFQQALGRRLIVRVDGFAGARQGLDEALGGRIETLVKF